MCLLLGRLWNIRIWNPPLDSLKRSFFVEQVWSWDLCFWIAWFSLYESVGDYYACARLAGKMAAMLISTLKALETTMPTRDWQVKWQPCSYPPWKCRRLLHKPTRDCTGKIAAMLISTLKALETTLPVNLPCCYCVMWRIVNEFNMI